MGRALMAGVVPNGAVTSAVLVHLRVEPAHFDWRWRERPVLALLAWEALARDPLARLRRIQVESTGATINFRPAAITHRDIAASALLASLHDQADGDARSRLTSGCIFLGAPRNELNQGPVGFCHGKRGV
jgi:hypothetical protein